MKKKNVVTCLKTDLVKCIYFPEAYDYKYFSHCMKNT